MNTRPSRALSLSLLFSLAVSGRRVRSSSLRDRPSAPRRAALETHARRHRHRTLEGQASHSYPRAGSERKRHTPGPGGFEPRTCACAVTCRFKTGPPPWCACLSPGPVCAHPWDAWHACPSLCGSGWRMADGGEDGDGQIHVDVPVQQQQHEEEEEQMVEQQRRRR